MTSITTKPKSTRPDQKLPLYGHLDINDLFQFLYKSKMVFYESLEKVYKPYVNPKDFNIIGFIGNGSFAKVYLVINVETKQKHAMKVMNKMTIVKLKQIDHIRDEKNITLRLNFPFVMYLEHAFLDNSNIYFVMPLIEGGELFNHLTKLGKFEEEQSRFLCAQIVLGLEYLHYLNVIYRDLKPENIMIDHIGYLKISDFGFAKILKDRTYTFCGTPEYIAPEVIMCQGYGLAADWWAFGVLLFELNAGQPPFRSKHQITIYEKAATLTYTMPKHFSKELSDLITNILQTNLSRRYGNLKNGVNDIKEHQWFKSTLWMAILNRKLNPPYIPDLHTPSGDVLRDDNTTIVTENEDIYREHFVNF